MLVSHKKLLVEWGHCDPAGIVFFPQYLAWFDDCTTALFMDAGMPIQSIFKEHGVIGIPVVDVRARFILPSKFGDELTVESTVMSLVKAVLWCVTNHESGRTGSRGIRHASLDRSRSERPIQNEVAPAAKRSDRTPFRRINPITGANLQR